jgi:hypothetical protein
MSETIEASTASLDSCTPDISPDKAVPVCPQVVAKHPPRTQLHDPRRNSYAYRNREVVQ